MMRREDKFILLLSRCILDEEAVLRTEEFLGHSLDWKYFFDQARRESVGGFIYRHLKNRQLPDKAAGLMRALKEGHIRLAALNILIGDEIKKTAAVFNREKIPVILLKGLFLLEEIYQDVSLRPITDVDILIKKEDLSRANEILISLGYVPPRYCRDFLEFNGRLCINSLLYTKESPVGFTLHLHWHLVNTTWPLDSLVKSLDMNLVWEHARPCLDKDFLTMSPEHLVIYLSYHAILHLFDRWVYAVDIREVICRYKDVLDWDSIDSQARQFGLESSVYNGLEYCSRLLVFYPSAIGMDKPRLFGIVDRFFYYFMRAGVRGSYFLVYMFYFFQQRSLADKMRYIKNSLFPSAMIIAHNLNLPLSEVTYLHYWRRIV